MAMNKLTTVGYLTRDPELREVSGVACLNFSLASDSKQKDAEGKYITNFYSCTAWRQLGEMMAKYLHKGSKIAVTGDLLIKNYNDQNGTPRTTVQLTVTDFDFASTANNNGQAQAPAQTQRPANNNNGWTQVPNSGLPF